MHHKTRNIKHLEWCLGIYTPNGMTRWKGIRNVGILKDLHDRMGQLATTYAQGTTNEIEGSKELRDKTAALFHNVGPQVWPDRGTDRPWLGAAGDLRLEGWYPFNLYYSENARELFDIFYSLVVQKSIQKSKSKSKDVSGYEYDFNPETIFKDIPLPPDDSQDQDYREEIRITPPPTSRKLRSDRRMSHSLREPASPIVRADACGQPEMEADFPILFGDLPSPSSPSKQTGLMQVVDDNSTSESSTTFHDEYDVSHGNTPNNGQGEMLGWDPDNERSEPYSSPLTHNPKQGQPSSKGGAQASKTIGRQEPVIPGGITEVLEAMDSSDGNLRTLPSLMKALETAKVAAGSKRGFVDTTGSQGEDNSPSAALVESRLERLHEKQERKRQRFTEALERSREQLKEKEQQAEEEEHKTQETLEIFLAWADQKLEEEDEDPDENEEVRTNRQAAAQCDQRIEKTRASREQMEQLMREMMGS